MKDDEIFKNNVEKATKLEDYIKNLLTSNGIPVIRFDYKTVFHKCKDHCNYKMKTNDGELPYINYVICNEPSRPEFIYKSNNKAYFLECKYKTKKTLWVNKSDYSHYINWSKMILLPCIIVFFVNEENRFYTHKLLKDPTVFLSKESWDKNKVWDVDGWTNEFNTDNELLKFLRDMEE